jgi:ribosomal protein S18 acetylase RimI-like enzyme
LTSEAASASSLTEFLGDKQQELFGQFLRGGEVPTNEDRIHEVSRLVELQKLRSAESKVILIRGRVLGLISVSSSSWDTRVLGLTTAKINNFLLDSNLPQEKGLSVLRASLSDLRMKGHRLVIARVSLLAQRAIELLCSQGALLTDVLLTFRAELTQTRLAHPAAEDFDILLASKQDRSSLRNLSQTSFRGGHFHSDPRVEKSASDRVYAEIATEQLQSHDWVVVKAERESKFAGFLSFSISKFGKRFKYGQISLLAVSPMWRRFGVATQLLRFVADYLSNRGVKHLFVSTQATNFPAIALYESAGFVNVNSSCTFHIWLD